MTANYEVVKEWRKHNKEKVAAQARRYRIRHPDKIRAIKKRHRELHLEEIRSVDAEAQRRRRASDPDQQRLRNQAYLVRQEQKRTEMAGRPRASSCELCGIEGRTLFDHCHDTGLFRGWICDRCNKVLGLVADNVGLLASIISYLEDFRGKVNDKATRRTA